MKARLKRSGGQKKAVVSKAPRVYMTSERIRTELLIWASRLRGFVPRDQLPTGVMGSERPLPELRLTDTDRIALANFLEQLAMPPPDRRGKPSDPKVRGRRLHMALAYDLWKLKWIRCGSTIPSEKAADDVWELWREPRNRVLDAYGKEIKKGKGIHRGWAASTLRIARRLNPQLKGFSIIGPFCARLHETMSESYSWASFATDPLDWLRHLSSPLN